MFKRFLIASLSAIIFVSCEKGEDQVNLNPENGSSPLVPEMSVSSYLESFQGTGSLVDFASPYSPTYTGTGATVVKRFIPNNPSEAGYDYAEVYAFSNYGAWEYFANSIVQCDEKKRTEASQGGQPMTTCDGVSNECKNITQNGRNIIVYCGT